MKISQSDRTSTSNSNQVLSRNGDGHFFDKSGTFFNRQFLQAKLTVNETHDHYEKEADAMADKAVQRPGGESLSESGNHQAASLNQTGLAIQQKCAGCEHEEKLREKGTEIEGKDSVKDKLQTKPIFDSNAEPPDDVKLVQRKCAECEKEEKLQKKPLMIQMQEEPGAPSSGSPTSETGTSSPTVEGPATATQPGQQGQFIVDDSATPQNGQMRKSDFLERLNGEICVSVDEALKGSPFSSNNCPYIRSAFARYRNSSAFQLEQTIQRYEPATRSAQNAQDIIQQVKMHVSAATSRWLQTGDLSGVPKEIADQIPNSVKTAVGIAGTVSSLSQSVSSTIGSIASGIGSVASSIGNMFFKSDVGGAHSTQSPHSVMQSLGKGHSLDGGSRGKMESAFGSNFSNVEMHNDGNAANLSKNMNARAFTVGNHIAFANGEYKPGTLVGDALMAHELAHVQQQAGTNNIDHHSYDSLENDADDTALGVMTKMMTGNDIGLLRKESKGLKTGLRLSRCGSSNTLDLSKMNPQQLQEFKKNFITKNFEKKDRDFATKILNDMIESNELSFKDENALRIEISKRMDTSRLMQKSQDLYGKAFEYPNHPKAKACLPDNKDGKKKNPRVNEAAQKYWGPVQYDDNNIYYFELTKDGKENGYEALKLLFTPQNSICKMTLIHCDFLASVIHLLVFADSIGPKEFNDRVKNGDIEMKLTYYGFTALEDTGWTHSSKSVSLREVRPGSKKDLVIGDHVIFWNHRAYNLLNVGVGNAWKLENAFLIKKKNDVDLFQGHGSGIKTDETMRKKLAEEFRDVVDIARKIIKKTRSKKTTESSKAMADMKSTFPNVVNISGKWRLQGSAFGKNFDLDLEGADAYINENDPDLTGLQDPNDPTKMNCVKRPSEAPGESC